MIRTRTRSGICSPDVSGLPIPHHQTSSITRMSGSLNTSGICSGSVTANTTSKQGEHSSSDTDIDQSLPEVNEAAASTPIVQPYDTQSSVTRSIGQQKNGCEPVNPSPLLRRSLSCARAAIGTSPPVPGIATPTRIASISKVRTRVSTSGLPTVKSTLNPPIKSNLKSPIKSNLKSPVKSTLNTPVKSTLNTLCKGTLKSPVKSNLKSPVTNITNPAVKSTLKSPVKGTLNPAVRRIKNPAVKSTSNLSVKNTLNSSVKSILNPALKSTLKSPVKSNLKSPIQSNLNPRVKSLNSLIKSPLNSSVKINPNKETNVHNTLPKRKVFSIPSSCGTKSNAITKGNACTRSTGAISTQITTSSKQPAIRPKCLPGRACSTGYTSTHHQEPPTSPTTPSDSIPHRYLVHSPHVVHSPTPPPAPHHVDLPWSDTLLKRSIRRTAKLRTRRTSYDLRWSTSSSLDDSDADVIHDTSTPRYKQSADSGQSGSGARVSEDTILPRARTCVLLQKSKDGVMLKTNVATINPFQTSSTHPSPSNLRNQSRNNERLAESLQGPISRQALSLTDDEMTFSIDEWNLHHRSSLQLQHLLASQSFDEYQTQHFNNGNIKRSADAIIREKDKIIEKQQFTIHELNQHMFSNSNFEKLQLKLSTCEYELFEIKETKDNKIKELELKIKELKRECKHEDYNCLLNSECNVSPPLCPSDETSHYTLSSEVRRYIENTKVSEKAPTSEAKEKHSLIAKLENTITEQRCMLNLRENVILSLQTDLQEQKSLHNTQANEHNVEACKHQYQKLVANCELSKKCVSTLQETLKKVHESNRRLEEELVTQSDMMKTVQCDIDARDLADNQRVCQLKNLGTENQYLLEQHMKALKKIETSEKRTLTDEEKNMENLIEKELKTSIKLLENLALQFTNIIHHEEVDISSLLAMKDEETDDSDDNSQINNITDLRKRMESLRKVRRTMENIQQDIASKYADSLIENTESCVTQ